MLTQARMFQWKPDGDVTFMFAQDANGVPVNLLQDPLHYPYGTKFMAPGPLGQCHPCPDDENLKKEMIFHATNYQRIHDMYNLDYDPPPGSNLYKALKLQERVRHALNFMRMRGCLQRRRYQKKLEDEKASRSASSRAGRRRCDHRMRILRVIVLS